MKNTRPISRHRSEKERAQSLMEMAVSFTILMLLLAGAVDFGRIFFFYIAILDASQEGAVYAAIEPANDAAILNRVRASSTSPLNLATDTNVSVAVADNGTGTARCAGSIITVTVTYQYTFTMPFIGTVLPNSTFPLSANTSSVILRDSC